MNRKGWQRIRSSKVAVMAALCAAFSMLAAGCAVREPNIKEKSDKLNVVTTLFPYYDFLRQVAGDKVDITLVVPAGMASHSFEPTPADVITIQNADLVVCNGGEMEQWFIRVLDSFGDGPSPKRVVTMMDYVDTLEEETVEGMEAEEHEHGGHSHDEADEGGHDSGDEHDEHSAEELHGADDNGHGVEIEYDEHIWTSPVNAMKLVEIIADVLEEEDPSNGQIYRTNEKAYIEQLSELDQEFREIVGSGKRNLLVFGDKFPLRYFFDEYGLTYRAAFSGCSTDTEPSAATIAYLIEKVREEQIPAIYYLELSSRRVAEIIGEETDAKPLLFHSCHNVTRKEFDAGVTYLDLMRQNAENLRKGLN